MHGHSPKKKRVFPHTRNCIKGRQCNDNSICGFSSDFNNSYNWSHSRHQTEYNGTLLNPPHTPETQAKFAPFGKQARPADAKPAASRRNDTPKHQFLITTQRNPNYNAKQTIISALRLFRFAPWFISLSMIAPTAVRTI
jgi:hypothetical protein